MKAAANKGKVGGGSDHKREKGVEACQASWGVS